MRTRWTSSPSFSPFFGVAPWDSWQDLWTKDAAYRTSPVFEINPSAMGAGLYFVGAGEWVEL